MANFELLTLVAGKQKRQNSNAMSVDFTAIAIGADALALSQGGSGAGAYFDFGARAARSSFSALNASDLTNKAYVDNAIAGLKWKNGVRALATTDITLEDPQTIDTVSVVAEDRVGVIGQTLPEENGIYIVKAGAWVRASDFDASSEVVNAAFFVEEGSGAYSDSAWVCTTNAPVTIGVTGLSFSQFAGGATVVAGAGLLKTGNTLDVQSADNSMTINADSIQVKLNAAGAIVVSGTGLQVQLEASSPSLQISSNELGLKMDAAGALAKTASGVKVQVEASNPSLQISANELGVKLDAAGAIVKGAGGIKSQLEASNPSLQISSNELGVKLDGAGAITKGASGVKVELEASNPSLQISSNQLGIKLDAAGAIVKGASGTAAQVDSGLVGTMKIASNKITVDHAVSLVNDNGSAITVRKVVYIKTNGAVDLASKSTANLDLAELGMVEDASIATTATGKISVRRGAIVGGFTALVPGEKYFVDSAGSIAKYSDITFSAGNKVYSVGRALSATEIVFNPMFEFEY